MEPDITETLDEQVTQVVDLLPALVVAIGVFLVFTLVGWLLGRLVRLALQRRGNQIHSGFLSKLPTALFAVFGLIVAMDYLGLQNVATGLLAGGGATAIILGFAFREVGENLLAGIFLIFSRPFRIGDLVQSGGLAEGIVKAVDLRNTHVRTTDGRDVFIPNAHIFNQPLVNFTRDGLRRPTFTLGLDYHDPIDQARAAILGAIREVPGVLASPAASVNIIELAAAVVTLEVSVWINTFAGTDYAQTQSDVMEATRQTILAHGWSISADTRTRLDLSGEVALRCPSEVASPSQQRGENP